MYRFLFILLVLNFQFKAIALDTKEDSLTKILINTKNDSIKVETLIQLSYIAEDFDSIPNIKLKNASLKLHKALDIARNSNHKKLESKVKFELGHLYDRNNKIDSAIFYFNLSLQDNILNSDSINASNASYRLGRVYYYSKDFTTALKFFKNADDYNVSNPDKRIVAIRKMAIGVVYEELDSIDKAIYYQELGLAIVKKNNHENEIPIFLNNLAVLHSKSGNREKAKELLNESIEISEKYNFGKGTAFANYSLGNIFYDEGNYALSIQYLLKGVDFWESINSALDLKDGYLSLYKSYKQVGNDKLALNYLEKNINIRDSIYSEEKLASLAEFDAKFKSQEQELTIQNQKFEIEKEKQEKELINKEKSFQFYFFSTIIILLLFNGIYFIIVYIRKKRVQKLIMNQKMLLEHKNNEILDSINYAKRVQDAILPDQKLFKENFSDAFVMYLPKDIVAGDFYWFEKIDNNAYFAVADCTGHGVPGAMVSVVCSNAIAKIVSENKISDPGLILDEVKKIVVKSFKKEGETLKDGMDISFCVIDLKTKELKWAGANNSIWIINESNNDEIVEIKGDKQPIGDYLFDRNFTTHNIQLNKGDQLYLTSDGYADQFGGPKGKKLLNKNLKDLLLKNRNKSMEEQYDFLISSFTEWKADFEQVDDVCIIGLRL